MSTATFLAHVQGQGVPGLGPGPSDYPGRNVGDIIVKLRIRFLFLMQPEPVVGHHVKVLDSEEEKPRYAHNIFI